MAEQDQSPPVKKSRWWLRLLPLVISLALIVTLLHFFEGFELFTQIDPIYFGIAVVFALFMNCFFGAYKWRLVMSLSDIRAPYWQVWRLWTGLQAATFFMPFQSGHLLFMVAMKKRWHVTYVHAVENVVYDKYVTIVGTFVLIALGQLILPRDHPVYGIWILLGALAVILFYLLDDYMLRVLSGFAWVRNHSQLIKRDCGPLKKLHLLLTATIYQSSDLISFFLACRALDVSVSLQTVLGVFSIVLLLSYIPVSFSGVGARAGLAALFLTNTIGYEHAVVSGMLVTFFEYFMPALFGLIGLHHALAVTALPEAREEEQSV